MTESFIVSNVLVVNSSSLGGNIQVGTGALSSLAAPTGTLSRFNTAIGYSAGSSISGGSNNVCIGYGANISASNSNGVAIGANASINAVANNTLPTLALGYGAFTTNVNVCTIGMAGNRLIVCEYGPHFCAHFNTDLWEGVYYSGGTPIGVTGSQIYDGLIALQNTGYTGNNPSARVISMPTAATIIAAMKDTVVGSSCWCKIAAYYTKSSTYNITISNSDSNLTWKGNNILKSPNYSLNVLVIVTSTTAVTIYSPK